MQQIPQQLKLSKNCNLTQSLSGFNKSTFLSEEVKYTALRVPIEKITLFQQKLSDFLLQEPGLDNPQKDHQLFNMRLLLLHSNITQDLKQIPADTQQLIQNEKIEVIQFSHKKQYSDYSLEDSLQKILPSTVTKNLPKAESLKDFKIIELTEQQQTYKTMIAEIYYDKSNFVKTVLNKKQLNNSNHRIFKYFIQYEYEYLFGKKFSEVEFLENSCKYKLDLLQIYCDISLQEERELLVSSFGKEEIVCDLLGDVLLDVKIAKEHGNFILNMKEQSVNFAHNYLNCLQVNNIYEDNKNTIVVWNDFLNLFKILFQVSLFQQDKYVRHLIIPHFMNDLTFLCLFVGLFKLIKPCNYFSEQAEDRLPLIHFYPLINIQEIPEEQDIKNFIIGHLNKYISSCVKQEVNLFKVTDIKSFRAPPHIINSKKLLFLSLQLNLDILNFQTPFFEQVIFAQQTVQQEASILQKRQSSSLFEQLYDINDQDLKQNPTKKLF